MKKSSGHGPNFLLIDAFLLHSGESKSVKCRVYIKKESRYEEERERERVINPKRENACRRKEEERMSLEDPQSE